MPRRRIIAVGTKFSKLTYLEKLREKDGHIIGRFLCDCGKTKELYLANVARGLTKSCGCYRKESPLNRRHGHAASRKSKTYRVWSAMLERCYVPSNKSYPDYGGRGITVCPEWRHSFDTFLRDMGEAPEGLFIDRIDNDKGYSPDNCRWVTRQENNSNRRNSLKVVYESQVITIAMLADITGFDYFSLRHQIVRRGLSAEAAVARLKQLHPEQAQEAA